jgi:DNA polymerase-3 subunit epsilon
MFQDNTSLVAMAEALSRSTDYRVLRRLVPRTTFTPSVGESTKTGILLDTETTGLDSRKDEVIELGNGEIRLLPDGRVVGVRGVFSRSTNHPSRSRPR